MGKSEGAKPTREGLNRSTVINSKTDFNQKFEQPMLVNENNLRAKSPDITKNQSFKPKDSKRESLNI